MLLCVHEEITEKPCYSWQQRVNKSDKCFAVKDLIFLYLQKKIRLLCVQECIARSKTALTASLYALSEGSH